MPTMAGRDGSTVVDRRTKRAADVSAHRYHEGPLQDGALKIVARGVNEDGAEQSAT
jgi:hypothetical protein